MGKFSIEIMLLEDKIKQTINNVDGATSEQILEIIEEIQPQFRSELTLEYLQGKIQKIKDISDEFEKKKQCKALLPYFNWYLQGL